MQLYVVHCAIRVRAKGDREKARYICREVGLTEPLCDMIARSVDWKSDQRGFVAAAKLVALDERIDPFWRGVANEHLGAMAEDSEDRVYYFTEAIDYSKQIADGDDRAYIEMCAEAGMADTPGASSSKPIEEVVRWMVEHGVDHDIVRRAGNV